MGLARMESASHVGRIVSGGNLGNFQRAHRRVPLKTIPCAEDSVPSLSTAFSGFAPT